MAQPRLFDFQSMARYRTAWALLVVTLAACAAVVVLSRRERILEVHSERVIGSGSEGPGVNFAVYVQCSWSYAKQCLQFVAAIHVPNLPFLVHIDARADNETKLELVRALEASGKYANVYLARPEVMNPTGISAVANLLNGYTSLLEIDSRWTHVINLSPGYLPMFEFAEVLKILTETVKFDKNVLSFAHPTHRIDIRSYQNTLSFDTALGVRTKNVPESLSRLQGEVHPFLMKRGYAIVRINPHVIIARKLVRHMLTEPVPRRMLLGFANADTPAEFYVASVILKNATFHDDLVPAAVFHTVSSETSMNHLPGSIPSISSEQYGELIDKGVLFVGKFEAVKDRQWPDTTRLPSFYRAQSRKQNRVVVVDALRKKLEVAPQLRDVILKLARGERLK